MKHSCTNACNNCPYQVFADLYRMQKTKVQQVILQHIRCPVEAEDLCHDVFMKFWTHQESWKEIQDPCAYLFRMAYNKAITHLRRQHLSRKFAEQQLRSDSPVRIQAQNLVFSKEVDIMVSAAVNQLPPLYREIYLLRRHNGRKIKEIASMLNISESTVKYAMRHTITRMSQHADVRRREK